MPPRIRPGVQFPLCLAAVKSRRKPAHTQSATAILLRTNIKAASSTSWRAWSLRNDHPDYKMRLSGFDLDGRSPAFERRSAASGLARPTSSEPDRVLQTWPKADPRTRSSIVAWLRDITRVATPSSRDPAHRRVEMTLAGTVERKAVLRFRSPVPAGTIKKPPPERSSDGFFSLRPANKGFTAAPQRD